MYRIVILDWDGTIGDTSSGALCALNRTLKKHCFPEIDNLRFSEISHNGAEYLIASAAGIPCDTEASRYLFSQYVEEYLKNAKCELFDGVRETLATLKAEGVILALLSNKMPSVCLTQLNLTDCAKYFSHVLCDDGSVPLKPAPDGIHKIIALCGGVPADALIVGDSQTDIQAGVSAGVATCYVEYGIGNLGMSELHPDYRISTFPELISIVRGT